MANNTATTSDTMTTEADVAVTGLTVEPSDPAATGPGTDRDISFTISNNGPSTARHLQFRVGIGPDAQPVMGEYADDCTIVATELVCTIDVDGLAPGATIDIIFKGRLMSYDQPGTYGSDTTGDTAGAFVHVSSTTPDSDLTNNDDYTAVTIGDPHADVQLTKTAVGTIANPHEEDNPHDAYVAGTPFSFQMEVSAGTSTETVSDATNVTLTDPMPTGFVATSVSTTQGSCQTMDGGASVTCELGTLAGSVPALPAPVVVTVHGTVDKDALGEQITNTATVRSDTPTRTGDPTEVTASAEVDVIEQADLQLRKLADSATYYAGGSVGYTLTVTNAGPSSVEDAVATDTLPLGLTLDTTASPNCSVVSGDATTGQEITCTVGSVGLGGTVSIRVQATTSPGDLRPAGTPPSGDEQHPRPIVNTATVSSSAPDPNLENNTDQAEIGRAHV
jgi:uncharacterized repeat protein (TIGR01451 family)